MKRSRREGHLLRGSAVVLFVLGAFLLVGSVMVIINDPGPKELPINATAGDRQDARIDAVSRITSRVAAIVGIVFVLMAMTEYRRGRQHVAELGRFSPEETGGAAVLYLREFGLDRPSSIYRWMVTSEEEQLMKALAPIGPAIAIGKPDEALPQLGAARVYYKDEEWQDQVEAMMRSARVVVIRTGRGDGLRWEVEQLIPKLKPEQLIVAVNDQTSLQLFQIWTSSIIRWPTEQIVVNRAFFTSIKLFLIFDDQWRPASIRMGRIFPTRGGLFQWWEFRRLLKPAISRIRAAKESRGHSV